MTATPSFLPEEDRDYLETKRIKYETRTETLPDGSLRQCVVFPDLSFDGQLYRVTDSGLVKVSTCELLVLIPKGYSTTKLDCFYTLPHLKLANNADPQSTGQQLVFGETRQFWSRHLAEGDWRPGVDGLETYLRYVRAELKAA